MLFNSYLFILLFLPATLFGFWAVGRRAGPRAGIAWLVLMSLVFYGYWSLKDLALIIILTFLNYGLGMWQNRAWERDGKGSRAILTLGIVIDLALLGYFKYTDFALGSLNALAGTSFQLQHIILPLGISFYTFQKIAFLADAYQGKTRGIGFLDYCLFVTFFPQLIAGPIVHHHDVIGQFQAMTGRLRSVDLSVGGTIFVFGLFKKVVIADSLAPTADALFTAAAQPGTVLTFGESWMGILAYSGQLYFDFSGYSDMAIGLARMFGVRMPMNFNSPYQARDIIEFWRRWHMTLSRFLRDYLYIPLGGNRHGEARRYLNLFLTFLIGGFWHGASWNFVVWGALHGLYTCVCHGWKAIRIKLGWTTPGRLAGALGMILTFLAVIVSWVFFRADGFATAGKILASMSGLNGFTPSLGLARWMTNLLGIETGSSTYYGSTEVLLVAGAMLMAWFAPNTMRIMRAAEPSLDNREVAPSRLRWVMNRRWAVITALLALIALQSMTRISHFLYFQF